MRLANIAMGMNTSMSMNTSIIMDTRNITIIITKRVV